MSANQLRMTRLRQTLVNSPMLGQFGQWVNVKIRGEQALIEVTRGALLFDSGRGEYTAFLIANQSTLPYHAVMRQRFEAERVYAERCSKYSDSVKEESYELGSVKLARSCSPKPGMSL